MTKTDILQRCYPGATPSELIDIATTIRVGIYDNGKGEYWDDKDGRVIYSQYQETGKDLGRWFIFYGGPTATPLGGVSWVDTTFLDHLTEELNGCKTAILKQCFPDATRNDLIDIANHVRKYIQGYESGEVSITYEYQGNVVYEIDETGTQFFTIDGITKQIDADGEETTFDAKSWLIYQG